MAKQIFYDLDVKNPLNPKDTWNPRFKDLSAREKSITSQNGENGIIEAIFEICIPQNKWCVDVGAANGKYLSNTYPLVNQGWFSLQIEPILETFKEMEKNLKDFSNVILLNEAVKREGLDEVLARYPGIPKDFDFLNIDIDSYDAEVWQNLQNYRPHLLCIECDESLNDLDFVSYRLHQPGSKPAASIGFLKVLSLQKDYEFVCATKCNAFFIEREFGKPLEI